MSARSTEINRQLARQLYLERSSREPEIGREYIAALGNEELLQLFIEKWLDPESNADRERSFALLKELAIENGFPIPEEIQ
jgi:hypothetical protein